MLWRLQNGELDNIRPKVRFNWASTGPEREKGTAQVDSFGPVMLFIQIRTPNQYLVGHLQVTVVWVGTNNHEHSAEQVAGGILAIAQLLTSRLPKTKVVVLVSEGFHFLSTVYLEYNISISCSVCIQEVCIITSVSILYEHVY